MLYQCSDISGVQNAIQVIFGVKIANPVRLPLNAAPKRMLHVKIERLPGTNKSAAPPNILFKDTHTTCYSSTYTLTPNAPFGNDETYSMTYYTDPPPHTNPPVITALSPATINAGDRQVLTIRGSNFGNQQGIVRFSSADDGGQTFLKDLDDQYYVSWSDTEIKVTVPSLVYKGYADDPDKEYRGGAGTGKIKIETEEGDTCLSPTPLTIPRSFMNKKPNDPNYPIQRVYLTKTDCHHDIVFALTTTIQGNQPAITAIEAALNKWSGLLGVGIALERDQNNNLVYVDMASLKSNKNLIFFSDANMQPSDMMVTANNYGIALDPLRYYQSKPLSIQIRPSSLWNYNLSGTMPVGKLSFYQCFLHEVGHVLLLQHVNNTSDLMYYTLFSGTPVLDINAGSSCVQAAATTVALSKSMVWSDSGPVTLGAPLNLTVSIELIEYYTPARYKANPSGGFPPYRYQWEYLSQGTFHSCSASNEPSDKQDFPVQSCPAPLQVTVTDACGNQAQAIVTPNKRLQADKDGYSTVYPNPNKGAFSITNITNATVYVYAATMNLVRTFENVSEGSNLDCSNLPNGIYFLKIMDNKEVMSMKMILNR